MLTIKKILNIENGFTLIEIITVVAILGIVVAAASNLFVSGYNLYIENKEKMEVQRELRFLTNYIDESIKYSENISLTGTTPTVGSGEAAIGIKNSHVVIINSSGEERNLSSIAIDRLVFSGSNNTLNLILEKDNYMIETDILLNNYSFSSPLSNKPFIVYKK